MCEQLDALSAAVGSFARGFDPRAITPSQAGRVVERCTRMEASIAAIKALAAARYAEGDDWKRQGCRSAADAYANKAGMTVSAARRSLDTGRRMANQPDVAGAALAGDLTPAQAEAVSDGAAADASKASELIEQARSTSLTELNDTVATIKAAAGDAEEARRRLRARRSLRRWTDRDGACHAHLYGLPEDGARLWRALDPLRRKLNSLHRQRNVERESFEALDYDALITLAAIATGSERTELSFADLRDLGLFPDVGPTRPAGPDGDPDPAPPSTPPVAGPPPATGESFPPEGSVPGADDSRAAPDDGTPAPDDGMPAPDHPGLPTGNAPDPTSRRPVPAGTGTAGDGQALGARPRADAQPSDRTDPPRSRPRLPGGPIRLMIRVDLDTLLRGVPADGELCEISGWGPVPVSVIEALAASESTFLVGLLTKSQQVLGVYHHTRHPTSHQRSALDFVQPTCQAAGCPARAGLQYDHREDWARTKFTLYDLLDRLCPHHHRLKTDRGWALVDGTGKRPFVPPDDPRHPRRVGSSQPGRPVRGGERSAAHRSGSPGGDGATETSGSSVPAGTDRQSEQHPSGARRGSRDPTRPP